MLSEAGGLETAAPSHFDIGKTVVKGLRITAFRSREILEVCIDSLNPFRSPATLADLTIYPPASQHGVFYSLVTPPKAFGVVPATALLPGRDPGPQPTHAAPARVCSSFDIRHSHRRNLR